MANNVVDMIRIQQDGDQTLSAEIGAYAHNIKLFFDKTDNIVVSEKSEKTGEPITLVTFLNDYVNKINIVTVAGNTFQPITAEGVTVGYKAEVSFEQSNENYNPEAYLRIPSDENITEKDKAKMSELFSYINDMESVDGGLIFYIYDEKIKIEEYANISLTIALKGF